MDVNHTDFKGRAVWGGNFVPGSPDVDENGHGTILAGIAAGTEYGVAKEANIISVKVSARRSMTGQMNSSVVTVVFGSKWHRRHWNYHRRIALHLNPHSVRAPAP